MKIMTGYNAEYQNRISHVINSSTTALKRVLALRVDLRCSGDELDIRNNTVMSRFINSFKSKLAFDCMKKERRWQRTLNQQLFYVWVREYGPKNGHKHYHVLLLLNKDIYHSAGRYNDEGNLASLIQQAWCSALGLPYPLYASLVHFPKDGNVYLQREHASFVQQKNDVIERTQYLAKHYTKPYHDGERSIGTSRC